MTGEWWQYLLVLGSATALCALLTPRAIWLAFRTGLLDEPGGHKSHESPLPYFGGLAIVVSFGASVVAAALVWPPVGGMGELWTVLGVAVVLGLVGLFDDLRHLSPGFRLLAEVAAAAVIWRVGAGVSVTGNEDIDFCITVIWVVGITNAFNLLDNMDGLSAGLASIACLGFFAIAVSNGQYLVAGLAIGLCGCALGFLKHNFHPATIFMGDAGALFIGFLVSYLGLKVFDLRFEGSTSKTFMVPLLVCSVPILDTSIVILSRLRYRRPLFLGGQDHLSHRLVKVGLSVPVAVGATYFVASGIGVISFVVSRVDLVSAWILGILVLVALLAGGVLLSFVPVYGDDSDNGGHFMIKKIDPKNLD